MVKRMLKGFAKILCFFILLYSTCVASGFIKDEHSNQMPSYSSHVGHMVVQGEGVGIAVNHGQIITNNYHNYVVIDKFEKDEQRQESISSQDDKTAKVIILDSETIEDYYDSLTTTKKSQNLNSFKGIVFVNIDSISIDPEKVFKVLSAFKSLKILNLNFSIYPRFWDIFCNQTPTAMPSLFQPYELHNLEILHMANNGINDPLFDQIIDTLHYFKNLRILNIVNNPVSEEKIMALRSYNPVRSSRDINEKIKIIHNVFGKKIQENFIELEKYFFIRPLEDIRSKTSRLIWNIDTKENIREDLLLTEAYKYVLDVKYARACEYTQTIPGELFEWLEEQSIYGDQYAQFCLGTMYYNGVIVNHQRKQNISKAIDYFVAASAPYENFEVGNVLAQNKLVNIRRNNEDFARYIISKKEVVKNANAIAQSNLGVLLEEGQHGTSIRNELGINKDPKILIDALTTQAKKNGYVEPQLTCYTGCCICLLSSLWCCFCCGLCS